MRAPDPERYLVPAGRGWEVAVGFAVGFFGVLFLGFLALGLVVFTVRGVLFKPWDPPVYILAGALLVLGLLCLVLARRLVTGRGRRDGGLFGPLVLRVSGVGLIVFAWWRVLSAPTDWWAWLHLSMLTTGGIACFVLAARREDTRRRNEVVPADPSAAGGPLPGT